MAGTSSTSNLLSLPAEILKEILTYLLATHHQIASFCTCNHDKRGLFKKRVRLERPNDLKLVNKTFASIAHGILPGTLTAVVCSSSCLKGFLRHLKSHHCMKEIIQTINIREKRKLPVDVCNDNKRLLKNTAKGWAGDLAKQCGWPILRAGHHHIVETTRCDIDEAKSMALLTVEYEIVGRLGAVLANVSRS